MPSPLNGIERTSCKGQGDSRWCAISLRQRHKVPLSKYSYWQVCSEVLQYQNQLSEMILKKKKKKEKTVRLACILAAGKQAAKKSKQANCLLLAWVTDPL